MDLKGEYRIAAPREHVWGLINDPDVLRDCIPGCESLDGSPESGFTARVTTKIGPVKATFAGEVTLSNVVAPESLTISGEGKGGVAGFAKGGADVHLAEDGADTVLTYLAKAQVGGKLAQLGARLIDSTAKKLADEFFEKLAARAVEGGRTSGASTLKPLPPASELVEPASAMATERPHIVSATLEPAVTQAAPAVTSARPYFILGVVAVVAVVTIATLVV
jgi:carbon monoxide dehydrogenase subunit G